MKLLAILKKPTKAESEKHFEEKAVGGNHQDIVNIGFLLDIGDISGEIDGNERQNVFRKVWGRFGFDNKEQEQFSRINARIWRSCCLLQRMAYQYEYGKAALLILPVDFTMYAIY